MVIVIKKGSKKSAIDESLKKLKGSKKFPASQFTGKLKIKDDPLLIQKRLRDEWG